MTSRRYDDAAARGAAVPPHGHPRPGGAALSRRSLLAAGAGTLVVAGGGRLEAASPPPARAQAADEAPYPWADNLRLERVDAGWLWKRGGGSDQWPHVQVSPTEILAAWGDGWGWTNNGTEQKAYLGLTRIGGTVSQPTGADLFRTAGYPIKPCTVVANNGAPILYVTSDVDGRDATRVMFGTGDGNSFSVPSGPVISRSIHGLQVIGSYERTGGAGKTKVFLYLAADGNIKSGNLEVPGKNSRVYMATFDSAQAASPGTWSWYAGGDAGSLAGRTMTTRAPWDASGNDPAPQPVFEDPAGLGKHFLVSWCPATGTFIAAKTQNKTGLALFSSPWIVGPWRTIWYDSLIPDGGIIFTAKVVSMWSTGGTVAVLWSGAPNAVRENNYDAAYLTRFRIATPPAATGSAGTRPR